MVDLRQEETMDGEKRSKPRRSKAQEEAVRKAAAASAARAKRRRDTELREGWERAEGGRLWGGAQ
jgi:hypothetical protein